MTNGEKRAMYREMVGRGLWGYEQRYDAFYVVDTGEWVEPECSDECCEFCVPRPDKRPLATHS